MIKKIIVISFFILSNQIFSFGFGEKTLTNITLKNEFGIANVSKITRKIEDLESSRNEMDFFKKEPHRVNNKINLN